VKRAEHDARRIGVKPGFEYLQRAKRLVV
jgi:hypothetical protein